MKKVLGFIVALVAAFVLVMPSVKADGAITAQEQQILDALKQPITIKGKTFYVPQQYLTQAENELKQNDYSASQVQAVLSEIDSTIALVEASDIDVTNVTTFEQLVKVLPADLKLSIEANIEKAADVLGLKIVFANNTFTVTKKDGSGSSIAPGNPVKQTGANYMVSFVAAASLLVVAAGAFVVGKKAEIA